MWKVSCVIHCSRDVSMKQNASTNMPQILEKSVYLFYMLMLMFT